MLCKQVARLLYFRIFFLSKNIVTTNVIFMYYYAEIKLLFIRRYIESSINLTSYPIRCKQFSFSNSPQKTSYVINVIAPFQRYRSSRE